MAQTSFVLPQRPWPGAGDPDDCWVLSSIQGAWTVAPWIYLPSVTAFRAAAGDPDNGVKDGGTVDDILKGIDGLWPELRPFCRGFRGATWATVRARYDEHRPISIAVRADQLPARLAMGVTVPHQVTIYQQQDGEHLFANPWAGSWDRWLKLTTGELAAVRDAALAYGKLRIGSSSIFAVSLPTVDEAVTTYGPARAYAAHLVAQVPTGGHTDAELEAALLEGRTTGIRDAAAAAGAVTP
jgi:hypothetical protein